MLQAHLPLSFFSLISSSHLIIVIDIITDTTNQPAACKYISEHSKAKVVVCDGMKQLEKYYGISKELPNLKALVVYNVDSIPDDVKSKFSGKVPVYTFEQFLELGKDVADTDLSTRSKSWKYGETCTLIYTSGTTGPPKAVMLTHDNITWTVDTALLATAKGTMDTTDCMISYLPLSHIAAQMLDMHMVRILIYIIYANDIILLRVYGLRAWGFFFSLLALSCFRDERLLIVHYSPKNLSHLFCSYSISYHI